MQIQWPDYSIELDQIKSFPGVHIIPVTMKKYDPLPTESFLWEGILQEEVQIKEKEQHAVPFVAATNKSETAFLGCKGNIIRGGGQNRQLAYSFVLGGHERMDIPVQCVQKGRWNPQKQELFSTKGGEMTACSLRFFKKSQQEVWATIFQSTSTTGTLSPTQDYTVFRDFIFGTEEETRHASSQISEEQKPNPSKNEGREKAQQILQALNDPLPDQVGILVILPDVMGLDYGSILPRYFLEIFGCPGMYAKIHKEIVSSFLLDILTFSNNAKIVLPVQQEDILNVIEDVKKSTQWQEMKPIGVERAYQLVQPAESFGEIVIWKERLLHFMYSYAPKPPQMQRSFGKEHLRSTFDASPASSCVPSSPKIELPPIDDSRYKMIRHLGIGGMGQVFLAEHVETGQKVAIKTMGSQLQSNMLAAQRFLQEVKVQTRLVHPNIVTILDSGYSRQTQQIFMVMEYVEGENLQKIIENHGPLPEKHAVKIALSIAKALEHAFEMSIIHRDIKPANILIDRNTRKVKVSDFGLGKVITESGCTMSGQMMGSPYYMSPEQIRNAKEVDHRADLYSLGATLYHMLAGRPPYSEYKGTLAIVRAKIKSDPVPLEEYVPLLREALSTIVRKAMARDPDERFQTATRMIEAIATMLENS